MYGIIYGQSARKSLKRKRKSGSFPEGTFQELLGLFIEGVSLPARFDDHPLKGTLAAFRECHLGFDLLVIYKRNQEEEIVTIKEVGTHPELFGR